LLSPLTAPAGGRHRRASSHPRQDGQASGQRKFGRLWQPRLVPSRIPWMPDRSAWPGNPPLPCRSRWLVPTPWTAPQPLPFGRAP